MKTIIEKDGYLAQVDGYQNLFTFAYFEKEAIMELKNVGEMMMNYHLEKVNNERIIKNKLTHTVEKYVVQV